MQLVEEKGNQTKSHLIWVKLGKKVNPLETENSFPQLMMSWVSWEEKYVLSNLFGVGYAVSKENLHSCPKDYSNRLGFGYYFAKIPTRIHSCSNPQTILGLNSLFFCLN